MFHVPQNFNDIIMLCRGRKNSKRVIFNGVVNIGNDSCLVNRIYIINNYIGKFYKIYDTMMCISIYYLNISLITENLKMRR